MEKYITLAFGTETINVVETDNGIRRINDLNDFLSTGGSLSDEIEFTKNGKGSIVDSEGNIYIKHNNS